MEGLRAEVRNLRSSNESLGTSKALLQRTLLEQMSAVRAELDEASSANADLEAVVARQKENASRLQ
eukprot:8759161-Pyramimonas_sp.AAC.1